VVENRNENICSIQKQPRCWFSSDMKSLELSRMIQNDCKYQCNIYANTYMGSFIYDVQHLDGVVNERKGTQYVAPLKIWHDDVIGEQTPIKSEKNEAIVETDFSMKEWRNCYR